MLASTQPEKRDAPVAVGPTSIALRSIGMRPAMRRRHHVAQCRVDRSRWVFHGRRCDRRVEQFEHGVLEMASAIATTRLRRCARRRARGCGAAAGGAHRRRSAARAGPLPACAAPRGSRRHFDARDLDPIREQRRPARHDPHLRRAHRIRARPSRAAGDPQVGTLDAVPLRPDRADAAAGSERLGDLALEQPHAARIAKEPPATRASSPTPPRSPRGRLRAANWRASDRRRLRSSARALSSLARPPPCAERSWLPGQDSNLRQVG